MVKSSLVVEGGSLRKFSARVITRFLLRTEDICPVKENSTLVWWGDGNTWQRCWVHSATDNWRDTTMSASADNPFSFSLGSILCFSRPQIYRLDHRLVHAQKQQQSCWAQWKPLGNKMAKSSLVVESGFLRKFSARVITQRLLRTEDICLVSGNSTPVWWGDGKTWQRYWVHSATDNWRDTTMSASADNTFSLFSRFDLMPLETSDLPLRLQSTSMSLASVALQYKWQCRRGWSSPLVKEGRY